MSQHVLQLTNKGIAEMIATLTGGTITFTKFSIGNGADPVDFKTLTNLVNPLMDIPLTGSTKGSNYVELTGSFNNASITESFSWNELGLWAKGSDNVEYLYAYMNQDSDQEYIPDNSSPRVVEETISAQVIVGNSENVSAIVNSITYASKAELEAHTRDTNNPHNVTKATLGLQNAETVPINEMKPSFTAASNIAGLVSGETVKTLLGKISKAVSTLIGHLSNSPLHITSTERSTWNGKADASHKHSAADINSGALSIARGGTGGNTVSEALNNLGAASSNEVKALKTTCDSLFYRPGDIINLGRVMCAGCLTGSGSTIGCYIPLARPINEDANVDFTNPGSTAITVRHSDGGYLLQNIKINQLNEMGTISLSVYENGIEFQYVDASAFSATNNVPVQVTFSSLKLTVG